MIDLSQDYFSLFGLPPHYRVDSERLDAAYRALQSRVHPDRFVNAGETERRLSMQSSAWVNEAYRALSDPVDRAQYLLSLHGIAPPAETDNALALDFLEAQLERREAVAEARADGDLPRLEALLAAVRDDIAQRDRVLGAILDEAKRWEDARPLVRELRFLHRLAADVEQAIAERDD